MTTTLLTLHYERGINLGNVGCLLFLIITEGKLIYCVCFTNHKIIIFCWTLSQNLAWWIYSNVGEVACTGHMMTALTLNSDLHCWELNRFVTWMIRNMGRVAFVRGSTRWHLYCINDFLPYIFITLSSHFCTANFSAFLKCGFKPKYLFLPYFSASWDLVWIKVLLQYFV